MTDTEEKLEILEFNYKVLKAEYDRALKERDKLKSDCEKVEKRYEERYILYCEKVKDKVELQNKLENEKEKYTKLLDIYNDRVKELEGLKNDNKEMSIETCVLAVLLFIIMAVVAVG